MAKYNFILFILIYLCAIHTSCFTWESKPALFPKISSYPIEYQRDVDEISQLFLATQYSSAIKKLKTLENHLPNDWIEFCMGICHLFNECVDPAIPLLENHLEFEDADYFLALAFLKKKETLKAIDHLNRYLMSQPRRYQEEAVSNLGMAYLDFKQNEKAKPFLLQAISIPSARKRLIETYLKEGHQKEAENILHLYKDSTPDWFHLMGLLLYSQSHLEKAAVFFEKSGLPESNYYMGWCHLKLGNSERAVLIFQKLLKQNESEAVYLSLAQCFRIQNREIDFIMPHIKSKEGKALARLLLHANTAEDAEDAFAEYTEIAIASLEKEKDPSMMHLLGILHYKRGEYQIALVYFNQLLQEFPSSSLTAEALFWKTQCLKDDPKKSRTALEQLVLQYPKSSFAAEAYFHLYSYQDYIQGDKDALKHLLSFSEKFPDHSLILNALYLTGLDYTRDRKTPEGKWIRKKNLHSAIEVFEKLEQAFIRLGEPAAYLDLRYRAMMERGLLYYKIANESKGVKQKITLEFAEKIFRGISYPPFFDESSYWLAKTFIASEQEALAIEVLDRISKGYFLSLALAEKGLLAMNRLDWQNAISCFEKVEENHLSTDEKLSLWIHKSQCYKELKDFDQAMLILSKVINDEAISSLRLKAMVLRSEIYEMQGRFELARKQLEAASKKGGEWGKLALTKLEEEYGYPSF